MKTSILFYLTLVLMFMSFISCIKTPSQKPSQLFVSGQLPNLLETLVAPPLPDTIKENHHLLDVAIVDEGVDYFHPKLQPQIHFTHDPKTGKIIGAGRNFLSENNWAGTVLIDALPFAFGAKEISADGQIVEPLEDPLKTLDELNTIFMDRLVDKIKKEEDLKGTLFAQKIDHNSFSLLLALHFISKKGAPSYQKMCKKNSPDFKNPLPYMLVEKKRYDRELRKLLIELFVPNVDGFLRKVFDFPWSMNMDEEDWYEFSKFYSKMEGFCSFYQVTKNVLVAFDKDFTIKDKIRKMVSYQSYRKRGDIISQNKVMDDVITTLQKKWYKYHFKTDDSNFGDFVEHFCSTLSIQEWNDLQKNKDINEVKKILRKRLDLLYEMDEFSSKFTSDYREKNRVLKNKQHFIDELTIIDKFIESGYEKDLLCGHRDRLQLIRDSEKDFFQKYNNPYYDEANNNVSHGTHVAGIVATQDPNIGIVPIRVVTDHPENEKIHKEVQEDFKFKFIEWSKKPIIKEMISDILNIKDPILVENKLYESVDLYYEENNMDHLFFKELEESIKYIGEHKIKLANMSLGTNFSRKIIPNISDQSSRDSIIDKSNYNFLTYEYFKYHLAEIIKNKASGTLFVVAAGNNGEWLNGISRSALPCDLSSATLEESFLKNNNASLSQLPNYKLNQILCVGSLGPKDDFSPYTNILLTDTPFIFSYGESILSYYKQGNCKGSDEDFDALYGPFASFSVQGNGSESTKDFFKKKDTKNWHYKEEFYFYRKIYSMRESLHKAMKANYCHSRPYAVGEMSGTSMATPGVTGYLAKNVITKMQQDGLSNDQIYLHPAYSPKTLISLLIDLSPKYGKGMLKDVCKVVDIKKVEHPEEKIHLSICR